LQWVFGQAPTATRIAISSSRLSTPETERSVDTDCGWRHRKPDEQREQQCAEAPPDQGSIEHLFERAELPQGRFVRLLFGRQENARGSWRAD